MCNKTKFYQKFKKDFSERSFDPKETIQWLQINKIILMSWGYHNPTALIKDEEITGLMFKVNANHHKGWVLITLEWNDTYTVRFFSNQFNEKREKISDVYCDVLQETIDDVIEKKENYQY